MSDYANKTVTFENMPFTNNY